MQNRRTRMQSKGSVALFVLVGMALLFLIYGLTADVARLYAVKVQARQALNLALRAANTQIDMDALADPEGPRIVIQEGSATNKFYENLQQNMRLDANMNPVSGSIADGHVNVLHFQVVNNPPETYSFGSLTETLDKVGSTAIIEVPVRLSGLSRAMGQPDTVNIRVHSTVYIDLKQ